MLIFSWIVDHIPLWVWLTVTFCAAGALFYFFSPILVPLWNLTPKPVKIALGAVGAIIAAILYGRYQGAKDEREMQKRRAADAQRNRNEVDQKVDNMDEKTARNELDRWNRD